MTEIEQLLRNTMGLDASTLGRDTVQQAVLLRVKECGFRDPEDYLQHVRQSADELQSLIEAVVVPETSFFRHVEAFHALTEWVQGAWLLRPGSSMLRILSIPCSTGEEPYSIAMDLLDSGFPADRLCLDAIDISRLAVAQAAEGLYRENSFRSAELAFRDRHFAREAAGYRLEERIRQAVHFHVGNLHAPGFGAGAAPYDVILCRNVLIYFDHEKQMQTIGILARLLAPSGVLFVGPAEGCLMMDFGFAPIKQRMSFGFQRKPRLDPASPALKVRKWDQAPLPKRDAGPQAHVPLHGRGQTPLPPPQIAKPLVSDKVQPKPAKSSVLPDLAKARALADAGRLQDAEAVCAQLIAGSGVSAEVYALLGIVQDAMGRGQDAEESYRRAIYLDPAHQQALAHLAVIAERNNDSVTARRLRERARRAEHRKSFNPAAEGSSR